MALPRNITQAEVKRLLDYNPDTGLLSWKVCVAKKIRVGDAAGCLNADGYVQVGINGRRCLAHHIIWLWLYGEAPVGDVDHINRNPSDNRVVNLRCVSRSENLLNSRHTNPSGYQGVSRTACGKYNAGIHFNRKRYHIGNFDTAEKAFRAYCEAHVKLYGVRSKFSGRHVNPVSEVVGLSGQHCSGLVVL